MANQSKSVQITCSVVFSLVKLHPCISFLKISPRTSVTFRATGGGSRGSRGTRRGAARGSSSGRGSRPVATRGTGTVRLARKGTSGAWESPGPLGAHVFNCQSSSRFFQVEISHLIPVFRCWRPHVSTSVQYCSMLSCRNCRVRDAREDSQADFCFGIFWNQTIFHGTWNCWWNGSPAAHWISALKRARLDSSSAIPPWQFKASKSDNLFFKWTSQTTLMQQFNKFNQVNQRSKLLMLFQAELR